MSETSWTCQVETLKNDGSTVLEDAPTFTVGERFVLACRGPAVEWPSAGDLHVAAEVPKEQPYLLKILDTLKVEPEHLRLVAVSYRAEGAREIHFDLRVGEQRVTIDKLPLNVQSVVQAQEGQPPQPFPPFSFMVPAYPMWMWLTLAFVFVMVLTIPAFLWKLRRRRLRLLWEVLDSDICQKQLIPRLPTHLHSYTNSTNPNPLNELFRQIRRMQREWSFSQGDAREQEGPGGPRKTALEVLEHVYRIFLTRKLRIPAHVWSTKKIASELGVKGRIGGWRSEVVATLAELERAIDGYRQVEVTQFRQLIQLVQKSAQHVDEAHTQKEAQ